MDGTALVLVTTYKRRELGFCTRNIHPSREKKKEKKESNIIKTRSERSHSKLLAQVDPTKCQ